MEYLYNGSFIIRLGGLCLARFLSYLSLQEELFKYLEIAWWYLVEFARNWWIKTIAVLYLTLILRAGIRGTAGLGVDHLVLLNNKNIIRETLNFDILKWKTLNSKASLRNFKNK